MAFPTSCWFGDTLGDALTNGIALNLDTDTVKVALYTNSFDGSTTFDKNTDQGTYASGLWASNEVSYSGATPAAAQTLTNPSVSVASGKLLFQDSASTLAWTGATFTARGALVYSDTLSPKRGICAINFGSDVAVSAGTFTITWDATNKIAYISF